MFSTLRKATNFARGYCVPRVIVKQNGSFQIVSPSTAARRNLRVLWSNC